MTAHPKRVLFLAARLSLCALLLAALAGCSSVEEKVASILQEAQTNPGDAEQVADRIAALGEPAVPALISSLDNPQARIHVSSALAKIGTPAVPKLAEALAAKSDPMAKRNILNALRQIGPNASSAIDAVSQALDSDDEKVRVAAAGALGATGAAASKAAPKLAGILENKEKGVLTREAAANALGKIAPDSEQIRLMVANALQDPEGQVNQAAAFALGEMGEKGKIGAPHLAYTLQNHPDSRTRVAAAKALGMIRADDKDSLNALVRALQDPDRETSRGAIWSLGEVGPPARPAIPYLKQAAMQVPGIAAEVKMVVDKINAGAQQ